MKFRLGFLAFLFLFSVPAFSQVLLVTEDLESDDEGVNYVSNTFDDGSQDVWARTNNVDGPNNNTSLSYSNIQGSFWWVGEDFQSSDNPLGSTEAGYFMLKTIDVSAYQSGSIEVRVYLGANSLFIYETSDEFKINYAFNGNIATGGNAVGALPDSNNVNTGTYSTAGAFYGNGDLMIRDADLDGVADVGGDTLNNTLTEYTFTFGVGPNDTTLSVLIFANGDAGLEEMGFDQVRVFGSTTPLPPTVMASVDQNVSCNAGSDGSITATPSLGSTPYTYLWSNGGATATISGIGAGTYTVTLTDALGLTATASATITEPTAIITTTSVSAQVNCNGGSDGEVLVAASGGTTPYTYNWSNGYMDTASTITLAAQSFEAATTDTWSFTSNPATYNTEGDSIIDGSDDVWAVLEEFTNDIDTAAEGLYFWGGQDLNNPNGGGFFYHTLAFDPIDVSTNTGVVVSFKYFTDGYDSSDSLQYQVKFDNNSNWDTTGVDLIKNTQAWVEVNVNVPDTANFVRLRFQARQDGSSDFVGFDDIKLGYNGSVNSGISAGTYTVTVTDANGCTDVDNITISNPSGVAATATVTQHVNCTGASDGAAMGSASNGTSPYTYAWSNGAATAANTGLAAGTYTLTVTDANGCTDIASVTITEPSTALSIAITSQSNVTVAGGSDGSATSAAAGGTGSYTYLWSNAAATAGITGVMAGTYTVTVTDANGCTATTSVTLSEPSPLGVSISSSTNVDCFGASTGSATATGSGGTAPYTYNWSNGGTGGTISGLPAGVYTVTLTDAAAATATDMVTISEPAALNATATVTSNVSCNAFSDGSVMVSATGGTGSYTYLWSNAATTASITGVVAGTYTVTVTDANGCTDVETASVTEPALMIASIPTSSNVTVFGGNNGSATGAGSGGTSPYTYSWSNGATTATAGTLIAGTYSVTVTDQNGCTDSASVIISQPSALSIFISNVADVDCNGNSTGSASVGATGGSTPYTYLWSNGATTSTASSLSGGTYTVTVSDASGATATATATVNEPGVLTLTASNVSNVNCNGGNDGSITVNTTGGTGPFSYTWSTGFTDTLGTPIALQGFEGTSNDNWNFTPSPATYNTEGDSLVNGSDDVWAVIEEFTGDIDTSSQGLYFWGMQDLDNPNGGGNFYHTLTFDPQNVAGQSGISVAFDYFSDGFDTSDSIEYQVEFDNGTNWNINGTPLNKNTQLWTTVVIPVPDTASFVRLRLQASQNGSSDYAGFDNVRLLSSATSSVSNLTAGSYAVAITDAAGCTTFTSINITEPTALSASITASTDVTCNGAADGSATATVSGGTTGYTYLWSNGATTATITGLSGGTYTVSVTDANGCGPEVDSVVIAEPMAITLSITASSDVTCNGAADGSATVTASGGTGTLTYLWSTNDLTPSVSNLGGGTYTVSVTDANFCGPFTATVTINEPTALVLSLSSSNDVTCGGAADGHVATAASGGTAPYTYLWSNAATTDSIGGLSGGTYTLTLTDANGCTEVLTQTLTEPTAITTNPALTDVLCYGEDNGAATLNEAGGVAPLTVDWGGANPGQLAAGTYVYTITDANNCTLIDSVTIVEPDSLTLTATVTAESVNGNDGAIDLSVSGGTAPYTYAWAPGAETTEDLSGLAGGTYTVTVTDDNGCTKVLEVEVGSHVGFGELNANLQVSLYPNPARDLVNLKWEGNTNQQVEVEVRNALGQIVHRSATSDQGIYTIDLSHTGTGIYFVQVKMDGFVKTLRVMME